MVAAFRRRRDRVVARFRSEAPGVEFVEPTGAFYFFFRVDGVTPGHDCTGTTFCEQAMAAGVAMVPGAAFGDDRWVRMSYAVSDKDLETALDRILGLIRSWERRPRKVPRPNWTRLRRAVAARGFTPASWIPAASEGRAEEATIRLGRLVEDLPIAGHPVGNAESWPGTVAFLDGTQRYEVMAYAATTPVVVAEIAAAVLERRDRQLHVAEVARRRLVIARPRCFDSWRARSRSMTPWRFRTTAPRIRSTISSWPAARSTRLAAGSRWRSATGTAAPPTPGSSWTVR